MAPDLKFWTETQNAAEWNKSLQDWSLSQISGTNCFTCELDTKRGLKILGSLSVTDGGEGFLSIPLVSTYERCDEYQRFNDVAASHNNDSLGLNGGHNESDAFKQMGLEFQHNYSNKDWNTRTSAITWKIRMVNIAV